MCGVEPIFFPDAAALEAWFATNHASAAELHIGFWKRSSGVPGITWPEAVEEALCVGWIDGVVHRIDDRRHRQRYTPRRPGSVWSAVNVAKVAELTAAGRMRPAGLAAFAARAPERTGVYTHEQRGELELPADRRAQLTADPAAAAFFDAQPRGYRRAAIWWVLSAKRAETADRRMAALVADSAAGRRLAAFDTRRPAG